ncbi:hypothetical protein DPMN_007090 [Dreissena polymorpha]|uniref:Uncharacterized protein n=1 Tax=Dreissena polymorpha TaxID=45954 RepID=A0A9D4RXZ7_DREPO|nr:hypothetical protein DPMN_007090 [Dreissena polymorpha]
MISMVNIISESQVGDGFSTDGNRGVVVKQNLLHYLKEKVEQGGREQTSLTDAH